MIKVFILFHLCIIRVTADTVIASWGNPPERGSPSDPNSASYMFGGDSSSSSSGDAISLSEFFDRLAGRSSSSSYSYPSSSNNYNYYQGPQPIYGQTGYTSGRINNAQYVQGQQNLNYNEYSYHYWRCINYYRGQYYYSYTFNGYVCDTRANRSG
uniref:Uncharacterized protein n=1 Tax=Panagrolaimus sp. PS1159 TaxID=55785 RepID=A0AC35GTB0_9BILA